MQMHVDHVHVFSKYNFLQKVLIKSGNAGFKYWYHTLTVEKFIFLFCVAVACPYLCLDVIS